jgi:hypothetical protein
MIPTMNYSNFEDRYKFIFRNNPELRYGQSIMTALATAWPSKYKEITGTDLDCYYKDDKAMSLLSYLENNWSQNETGR